MSTLSVTQAFRNADFGEIRTIDEYGKVLFCGTDAAKILGYSNPRKALLDHCKGVTKRDTLTMGGKQQVSFIPEGDLYRLITHSRLPTAEQFERWVFDEVLPTIRQTGVYGARTDSISRLRAELEFLDAQTRHATAWIDLGKLIPEDAEHVQTCAKRAMEALTQQMVAASPETIQVNQGTDTAFIQDARASPEQKSLDTFNATAVGEMLGISCKAVGRIANVHGLKSAENGEWVEGKCHYNGKTVQTFRYNNQGIAAVKRHLAG